jgi:hypothetical protein
MQFFESRSQGRDREGIERLHAAESIAEILVQVIAVLDARIGLCENPPLALLRTR